MHSSCLMWWECIDRENLEEREEDMKGAHVISALFGSDARHQVLFLLPFSLVLFSRYRMDNKARSIDRMKRYRELLARDIASLANMDYEE